MLFAYSKIDKLCKNPPTLWKYTALSDNMRKDQILSDA